MIIFLYKWLYSSFWPREMQLEVLKITYNWITIPIFLSFLVMSNDTVLHPKEKVELLMNKLIKTAMAIFRIISFGLSCTSLKRFSIAHRSPLTCLRVFTACSKTTSLKQEQLPTAREGNPSGLWHGSSSPGVTRLSPTCPDVSSWEGASSDARASKSASAAKNFSSEAQMCYLLSYEAYLWHADCHFLHSAVT